MLFAVRDDRAARCILREIENGERVSGMIVRDGHAALEACARVMPDILVIDAALPKMDGLGVVDSLRARSSGRMPRVIAGVSSPLAREAFERRGACAVLEIPWTAHALRAAVQRELDALLRQVNWAAAEAVHPLACALLDEMGMNASLKGYAYLSWTAALAYVSEERIFAIGKHLYAPVAERFSTTTQNVERLIRHAVESTMDADKARGVYDLLGNTIDPARGKPTNAQIAAVLVQRMRVMRVEN